MCTVEQALTASNAPGATFKPLRVEVATLVATARGVMRDYRAGLEPVVLRVWQHFARVPREVVAIACGYLL